jgi:type I restriction enzyme S subunit
MTNTTYKKTAIGLIPSDWEVKKLGEVSKVIMGQSPDSKNYFDYEIGLPLLQGNADIKERKSIKRIWTNQITKVCEENDIVMSVRAPVGTIAKASFKSCIGRGICSIQSNDLIIKQFLYSYLEKYETNWTRLSQGSTFESINSDDIRLLKIPIPPLPEQQKIASILSTWDVAIDNCKLIIEELKVRNKGLEKLLLNNEKCIVKSEKWEKVIIGELGTSFNGLTGKTKVDFGKGKPYIPFLNIFNNGKLNNNYYDLVQINENDKQQKVQYGDILFTVSSETPNEVGMSSVVLFQPDELYLNSFCFGFRLFDFNTLLPKFACYYFRADVFRNKITALAQGATRFNLSKNQFKKLELYLPSLEYQEAIAKILDNATEELNQYQQKLQTLQLQKKGLMQQLLTGKVRVKI